MVRNGLWSLLAHYQSQGGEVMKKILSNKKFMETIGWLGVIVFVLWIILTPSSSSSGGGCLEYYSGYDTGWSEQCVLYDYETEPVPPMYLDDDPFSDKDCSDIGEEVWVGDDDTDNLDADGDGWGCESYGG